MGGATKRRPVSFREEMFMAVKFYNATITVDTGEWHTQIPLSEADFEGYENKDAGAIEYVVGLLRQKASELDFDETNIEVVPNI